MHGLTHIYVVTATILFFCFYYTQFIRKRCGWLATVAFVTKLQTLEPEMIFWLLYHHNGFIKKSINKSRKANKSRKINPSTNQLKPSAKLSGFMFVGVWINSQIGFVQVSGFDYKLPIYFTMGRNSVLEQTFCILSTEKSVFKGGDMGDPNLAASDPAFYMFHAFLDKVNSWQWQISYIFNMC